MHTKTKAQNLVTRRMVMGLPLGACHFNEFFSKKVFLFSQTLERCCKKKFPDVSTGFFFLSSVFFAKENL